MRKRLIAVGVVAACGVGVIRWQATEPADGRQHDPQLLKDRLWVDHLPRNDRDRINVFVVLSPRPRTGSPGPLGIFEKIGPWEGHFEAFRYEAHGSELRVVFPQSGDRETITVDATTCNEADMDYCLEMSGNSRGVSRYYSRKGWEIRSRDDAEALAARLAR